jgi:hypothetical protein
MTRLGFICVILTLWMAVAHPQGEFTHANYRTIDLTSLGVSGTVTRVVLSPDSRFAAVEAESQNEKHLYVVELSTNKIHSVDPRTELEGYQNWKNSPIAELYPTLDSDPRWYPGKSQGQQWLLFNSNGIDNQNDLFLFRPSTKTYVRITESENEQYAAKWSNDGEYLSFLSGAASSELYVVPNMGRVFNEVEKLQMAYNHIPSLADVYSSAIFDRSKDLFFSTRERILDYEWLANGSIAFLQAARNDSSSARLYSLRSSGKARLIADVPGYTAMEAGREFSAIILLSPVKSDFRTLQTAMVFDEHDLDVTINKKDGPKTDFGSQEISTAPLICGKAKWVVPFAGRDQDALDFRTFVKGRARDQNIDIPLVGTIIDIDMRPDDNGGDDYNIIGAYTSERRFGLFLFDFSYHIDEDDLTLMEKKQFIEVGIQAHFSRFTGDVLTGDFQPGFGLWSEIRFAEGLVDFSAGVKVCYVPLTGSSAATGLTFESYFWSSEAFLKYTYPFAYEFQPYVSFGVGVAVSNERQFRDEPPRRQTPFFFDFSGGGTFTFTPRLNLNLILSFVKLSDDIDRYAKIQKTDSYIIIGLGMSYILSF